MNETPSRATRLPIHPSIGSGYILWAKLGPGGWGTEGKEKSPVLWGP